jgi:hypothetical protein
MFLGIALINTAIAADELPSDRVIQFLTNIHTGKTMDSEAWLLKGARDSKQLKAFGGLGAAVRQSSDLAHRYGGLRSVEIKQVTKSGEGYQIIAEVTFFDDESRRKSPAVAEREDMTWRFTVAKESGTWKLQF